MVLMRPGWCLSVDAARNACQFRDAERGIDAEHGLPVIRRSEMMQSWIGEGWLPHEQLLATHGLDMLIMADHGDNLPSQSASAEILRAAEHAQAAAFSE